MDADDLEEMSVNDKIDLIRATIRPADVVEMAEIPVVAGKIPSPWNPDDHTPSCHIYEDHFHDYSTGRGGDVIDLYRAYTGKSLGRAVRDLLTAGQSMDADPDRVRRVERAAALNLLPEFRAELADGAVPVLGGVDSEYLASLAKWGMVKPQRDRLLIPHYRHDSLPGIKIRYAAGHKGSWPGSQYLGLYSVSTALTDCCIIMEGESDCWALDAYARRTGHKIDVYALPSGAGTWRDNWLTDLDEYDKILTCFDNDHAGKQATDKVGRAIGAGRHVEFPVPTLLNDAREALSKGWEPSLRRYC